jgi:hypothetical protein
VRYQSASELLRALDKALPPAARGSDEEVGGFVQSLFGEQRRKSQEALAEALDRADKHQLSKSGTKFTDATLSGQSGVSGMSTVGVAASLAPPTHSLEDLDAALASGSKRVVKVAVAAGLGVVGALAALLVSLSGKEPEPPAAGKPAEVPQVSAPHVEAAPPPAALDPKALPVEPSSPSSEPPRRTAAPPAARLPAAPPAAKPTAPAASAPAAPKPSWKHDPGF